MSAILQSFFEDGTGFDQVWFARDLNEPIAAYARDLHSRCGQYVGPFDPETGIAPIQFPARDVAILAALKRADVVELRRLLLPSDHSPNPPIAA